MKPILTRVLAMTALLMCRTEAHACAACFGRSDSRLAVGMNWGIFTLLGFIICTLAGLSCFFVFLAVRSSKQPPQNGVQTHLQAPNNSPEKPEDS
jgi:hypothetical protein